MALMELLSPAACAPWEFATSRSRPDRRGKIDCRTTDRHDPAGVRRHLIVLGEPHLRRVLLEFAAYYNASRVHRSLNKDAPFLARSSAPARLRHVPFSA